MNQNVGYVILEAPSVSSEYNQPKILDASPDTVVIEAVLQEADVVNRNKRKYTRKALESGLNHPMFQEKLARKNLFGEANHPLSDSIERQSVVDQTRMSHIITRTWWEGNLLKGEVAAANTAVGTDFANLVRQKCEMAFSMRGLGGVVKKEGDITVVHDPLLIVTYDWIIFPSHSNAYQTKILKESSVLTGIHKDNTHIMHEGILIPCDYKEAIKSYIVSENKNIKGLMEGTNADSSSIDLVNDGKLSVSINTEDGKVVLFTESNIQKEINEFLRNL